MEYNSFSSAKDLSKVVIGLLFAGILVDVFNIIINSIQLIFFPDMGESIELSSNEMALGLTAVGFVVLNFIIYIATIITFLMWLYRSYKNLYVFNIQTPQASPGWAIGYWFIPFLNLFKPLSIVNEVWHGSDSERLDADFNYSDTSSPSLHLFWWLTWIFANILSNISTRLVIQSNDSQTQNIGTMLVIVATALTSIAAILLVTIIKNVTRRQEESASKIQFQVPPVPPTFN